MTFIELFYKSTYHNIISFKIVGYRYAYRELYDEFR